jgi:hypothetical protein
VTTLSQPLSHGPHPLVTSHIYSPLTLVSSRIASVNRHAQSFTPTTQNTTSLCVAQQHTGARRLCSALHSLNP